METQVSQYSQRRQYFRKYEHDNHKIRSDRVKKWYHKKRGELYTLLGGKCAHCGFSDIRVLQIDHVNGGGQKERKSFSCYYLFLCHVLEKVKNGSKDYQLLCANCNWIKRWEKKEQ
jgi:hypothetical protein